MGDYPSEYLASNTRNYHSEKNYLDPQLYIFHTLHNEKFIFWHIHHQKDYKLNKSNRQIQLYILNNFLLVPI